MVVVVVVLVLVLVLWSDDDCGAILSVICGFLGRRESQGAEMVAEPRI